MKESINFYVLTDTHYVSKKCWDCKTSIAHKSFDPIQFKESEEILREACDIIKQDDRTDIVLMLGDNTNAGDFDSLSEVSAIMQELVDAGKQVFAIVAGHDGHGEFAKRKAIRFAEDGSKRREGSSASRDEARQTVQQFGFNQALDSDSLTGSYIVPINDEIYYLAISEDPSVKKELGITQKQRHLHNWVENILKKYKSQGKTIFAGIHYPVIYPSKIYSALTNKLPDGQAKDIVNLLADNGVNLVFTGHTHIHNIACTLSANKNCLYDVSTNSLTSFPPIFRKVQFYGKVADIRTIELHTLSRFDLQGKDLKEYASEPFISYIKSIMKAMTNNYDDFLHKISIVGVKAKAFKQFKFILRPICKYIGNLSLYKLGLWSLKETGLSKQDIINLKNSYVVDFSYQLIVDLFNAKNRYTPQDIEYKVIMGVSAIIDSAICAFRINLKDKIGFATFSEVMSDLMYNAGIDKCNAKFIIDEYQPSLPIQSASSKKGTYLLALIVFISILLFPLTLIGLIVTAVFKLRANSIKKKKVKKRIAELNGEWDCESNIASNK